MQHVELFHFLECTNDAAFAVTPDGDIRSWNSAAERLFGYSAAEAVHRGVADLLQGRGSLGARSGTDYDFCHLVTDQCEIPDFDLRVRIRSGGRIWVNISTITFRDGDGEGRLVVHLARDITQRKKAEAALRRLLSGARQLLETAAEAQHPAPVQPLSEQEQRILRLLAQGHAPPAVARMLDIAPQTLRNHLHHVNRKLRTNSRLEAVTHALQRRLI